MITELILGSKPVNKDGRDLVLVTTASGKNIWVNKAEHDASAETVSYAAEKAGQSWTNAKTGATGIRKVDTNTFKCFGKQIVKKSSTTELFDYLISKGITPTFSTN